jgi:hypothetical protein
MDGFLDGRPDWVRNRVFEHFSCWELLPPRLRLGILAFLDPEDLGSAAVLSRQFRDDCLHPSLPQERTAVVRVPFPGVLSLGAPDAGCEDTGLKILARLAAMAAAILPDGRRKFHKFSRLRVVDPHQGIRRPVQEDSDYQWEYDGISWGHGGYVWGFPVATVIQEIVALDWSLARGAAAPPRGQPRMWNGEEHVLAEVLPNLREVAFAGSVFPVPLECVASSYSDRLEKITWPECVSLHFDGRELEDCRRLRELYVDGACFDTASFDIYDEDMYDDNQLPDPRYELPFLYHLPPTLERVSLKGAQVRCRTNVPTRPTRGPIPPATLYMFARNRPNLLWLRSDFSPETISLLKWERPWVAFVS